MFPLNYMLKEGLLNQEMNKTYIQENQAYIIIIHVTTKPIHQELGERQWAQTFQERKIN